MLNTFLNTNSLQILSAILDIAVLSIIFYFIYRLLRNAKIPLVFNQIGIILLIYIVASLFNLQTVLWVFKSVVSWVIIGSLIMFQPELRALIMRVDYTRMFKRKQNNSILPDFEIIKKSMNYLKKSHRGAIFVFPRRVNLDHIITSKVELNADLSLELIQTIFGYNTALHDGAIIIQGNKITHAGCFLPTERGLEVLYSLGARHRAALGLSQNSDSIMLVISEEYGSISLVFNGEFFYDLHIEKVCNYVEQLLTEGHLDIDFDKYETAEISK